MSGPAAAAPSTYRPANPWWRYFVPSVPAEVRSLVAASLLQSVATAGFSTYVAIWAVTRLGASSAAVGVALFLRAGSGIVTGYLGGRRSDRVGRRGVIALGWAAQGVCIAAFATQPHSVPVGLALVVAFGPLGPPAAAASAALVGDLIAADRREAAFAAMRAAGSFGIIAGPAFAALLLGVGGWRAMFLSLAAFSVAAVAIVWRTLPKGKPSVSQPSSGSGADVRAFRDKRFVLFLASATVITIAMAGTDRVLPISAVASYRLPASAWGLIVIISPVLVVLFQTAVTTRLATTRRTARIVAAAVLTGWPFLLLLVDHRAVTIAAVVVVSTFGEMVWVPTSQALTTEMAPAGRTGAYLGAYGGAVSLAFAVGPLLALEIRGAVGDGWVWATFAALSLVGATIGATAVSARPESAAPREAEAPT
jgi:predicted MFS family arabinose efflux permease